MSRCWIALTSAAPSGATASATLTSHGPVHGSVHGAVHGAAEGVADRFLTAWEAKEAPVTGAVKIDPRAIDPGGAAAWASLVLAPPGSWLLFDDVAVSHAIRTVLAGPAMDVVSTFVTGDDRFVGAIRAVHDDEPTRVRDDPFAALFPATLVRVGTGLLGMTPQPVGPVIQRYGGANPWPWDRFPGLGGRRG